MARQCSVCGKGAQLGNNVTTRGKKKYLGGVGTKITGISRRQFKPNLQSVKVTTARGTNKTIKACTQCIRGGKGVKRVRIAPFKLPGADKRTSGAGHKTR